MATVPGGLLALQTGQARTLPGSAPRRPRLTADDVPAVLGHLLTEYAADLAAMVEPSAKPAQSRAGVGIPTVLSAGRGDPFDPLVSVAFPRDESGKRTPALRGYEPLSRSRVPSLLLQANLRRRPLPWVRPQKAPTGPGGAQ